MAHQTEQLSHLFRQDVVTKADLASAFDVSGRTIERWIRLRQLPQPKRVGKNRIWSGAQLRQHVGLETAA